MSWQSYVDTQLIGTGKVSKAAIIGQQGGVWAASTGYTLSAEEQKAIITGFSNTETVQANGIRLGGQKFFTLQAAPEFIYGKKQADGCVIVKTKQAIIVAEYKAPIQQSEATTVVGALGDYLISVGY